MTHVFTCMGTAISLTGASREAAHRVEMVFEQMEQTFSLYLPGSEASRIARGELNLMDASAEMRSMYALAHGWREATDGAFRPHRPDGVIDLAGVVKATAIARAGEILAAGGGRWLINAGGDVLTDGPGWTVGLVDPADRGLLLSQFVTTVDHPAVATSGISERGEHIWRAGTGDEFAQVSVAASDTITADALATAIMAGGRITLDLAVRDFGVHVLAVTRAGEFLATSVFRNRAA